MEKNGKSTRKEKMLHAWDKSDDDDILSHELYIEDICKGPSLRHVGTYSFHYNVKEIPKLRNYRNGKMGKTEPTAQNPQDVPPGTQNPQNVPTRTLNPQHVQPGMSQGAGTGQETEEENCIREYEAKQLHEYNEILDKLDESDKEQHNRDPKFFISNNITPVHYTECPPTDAMNDKITQFLLANGTQFMQRSIQQFTPALASNYTKISEGSNVIVSPKKTPRKKISGRRKLELYFPALPRQPNMNLERHQLVTDTSYPPVGLDVVRTMVQNNTDYKIGREGQIVSKETNTQGDFVFI